MLRPTASISSVVAPASSRPLRSVAQACTSVRMSTLHFVGDSASEISVTPGARSLHEWLHSDASSSTLLGCESSELLDDGRWHIRMATVSFFGLELAPCFVVEIERPAVGARE
eukprot:4406562-Prymnesium_polylepis.1